MENLLDTEKASKSAEVSEDILTYKNLRMEKIVSMGQTSESWYDQEEAEWVSVLKGKAELTYEDGTVECLKEGCHTFIPPHKKHRVSYTSSPCVWLCAFIGE